MRASHKIDPVFDDPNLIGSAGLVPALRLAEQAGLHDLLERGLSVASPAAAVKSTAMVAGMLAGADSIDDLDLLRHGGMGRVFADVRAPSTLGTHLRAFTFGNVSQLDAAGSRLLAGLAGRAPGLLAGAKESDGIAFLDVDDTVREVYGHAKQAVAYGYTGARGLNIQLATLSTPLAAPVLTGARLRRGNAASVAGSGQLLARSITATRAAGVTGQILVRADSAYFGYPFVGAAARAGVWFSVTARVNPRITAAIASIDPATWTPIRYPQAVWDPDEQRWVSDAEVAEVPYTAFLRRGKTKQIHCRLVVRRVKRRQPLPEDGTGDGTEQGELFAAYRHHAFITNSTLSTIEADAHHRDHAVVEQVIAELKDGPLAHLPSGSYNANAAWVAHAVIAFNLARAAGVLAGRRHAKARWTTLRRQLINIPARIASSANRYTLHLPRDWPWAQAWHALFDTAVAPPTA